jgi:hypothetical protein
MSLKENCLLRLRERRRRSVQQSYEEGAQIRRRLQELLGAPTPMQEVETPSTYAFSENEPACCSTKPRLNFLSSSPCSGCLAWLGTDRL